MTARRRKCPQAGHREAKFPHVKRKVLEERDKPAITICLLNVFVVLMKRGNKDDVFTGLFHEFRQAFGKWSQSPPSAA